eukprot:scaffold116634_cov36-Phaeocystis_antarctica.AAC.1
MALIAAAHSARTSPLAPARAASAAAEVASAAAAIAAGLVAMENAAGLNSRRAPPSTHVAAATATSVRATCLARAPRRPSVA